MDFCKEFFNISNWDGDGIYECESCGNHVCKRCALAWHDVCPNCFGRLWRIS